MAYVLLVTVKFSYSMAILEKLLVEKPLSILHYEQMAYSVHVVRHPLMREGNSVVEGRLL
jgi:hypothetical protein